MPDLSIIVVTYNSGELVLDCLNSLVMAITNLSAEIILVDNCSQDGMPERIHERFPQIHQISNGDNLGFAAANNIGLSAAAGRYLLLVNPDVIVEPNALELMLAYLEAEPQIGLVGPRTTDARGNVAASAHVKLTPFVILWQYWGLNSIVSVGQFRRETHHAMAPFDVAWVQASCLMFRREVYEQIGGLDAGFFMFCEEPDYCERAARFGWRTAYLPQARVQHFESTTVSRYPLLKMRHYHISPLRYFRTRRQPISVLVLKIGFIAELSVKYVSRLIQNALKPEGSLKAKIDAYPVVIREIWHY